MSAPLEPGEEDLGPWLFSDGRLRRVSATRVQLFDRNTYGGCERRWWAQYPGVELHGMEPEPEFSYQKTGTDVHKQIERLLKTGANTLQEIAMSGWRFIPAPGPDLAVEHPIINLAQLNNGTALLQAHGVPFSGKIDLFHRRGVYHDENGVPRPEEHPHTAELVDWKSSADVLKYAKSATDLTTNIQMLTYAEYISRIWPDLEWIRLSHVYFQTRGKRYADKRTVAISIATVKKAWQDIEKIVLRMTQVARETVFLKVEPNYASCNSYTGCPRRILCPRSAKQVLADALKGEKSMSLVDRLRTQVGTNGAPPHFGPPMQAPQAQQTPFGPPPGPQYVPQPTPPGPPHFGPPPGPQYAPQPQAPSFGPPQMQQPQYAPQIGAPTGPTQGATPTGPTQEQIQMQMRALEEEERRVRGGQPPAYAQQPPAAFQAAPPQAQQPWQQAAPPPAYAPPQAAPQAAPQAPWQLPAQTPYVSVPPPQLPPVMQSGTSGQPGSHIFYGQCNFCGEMMSNQNASKLQDGSVKHIACPRQPAQVLPPDAPPSQPHLAANPIPPDQLQYMSPAVQQAAAPFTGQPPTQQMPGMQWGQQPPQGAPQGQAPLQPFIAPPKGEKCRASRVQIQITPEQAMRRAMLCPGGCGQTIQLKPEQIAGVWVAKIKTHHLDVAPGTPTQFDRSAASVTPLPPQLSASPTENTGIILCLDVAVQGSTSIDLDQYVQNCLAALQQQPQTLDWKSALAAIVKQYPPNGICTLNGVQQNEVKQVVFEALRPICKVIVTPR